MRDFREHRFWLLLGTLVLLLIGIPIADQFTIESRPFARMLLISLVFMTGAWALPPRTQLMRAGMILAIAGVVFNALALRADAMTFFAIAQSCLFLFALLSVYCTFRDVAFGSTMSVNRLVGAVCVYLLLGIAWSVGYNLLELAAPGSFRGVSEIAVGWSGEWLYFSFVTMTTLGYGDMSPLVPVAQAAAYFQAIVGQFYIAILVAGLVSAWISGRQRD